MPTCMHLLFELEKQKILRTYKNWYTKPKKYESNLVI